MSYSKFYKYILKKNEYNPDIAKNYEFNQNIKEKYGVQICLQNDLDAENLYLSVDEAQKFVEEHGSKYEAIIDEYNTVIDIILDHIEIHTVYDFKGSKVKLSFPKVHMQSLARNLSDHRLNLSKIHIAELYKIHYQFYETTFKMFNNIFKEVSKKTKVNLGIVMTEQQAKDFGYTYSLQRTYAGIKATITDVNITNSILIVPAQIDQFPVQKVHIKEIGADKHNHLLMLK